MSIVENIIYLVQRKYVDEKLRFESFFSMCKRDEFTRIMGTCCLYQVSITFDDGARIQRQVGGNEQSSRGWRRRTEQQGSE